MGRMAESDDLAMGEPVWRIVDDGGYTTGLVLPHAGGLRLMPASGGGDLLMSNGPLCGAIASLELSLPRGHWLQGDCWLESEEANDPINLNFCLSGSCLYVGESGGRHVFQGQRLAIFVNKPAQVRARVRNGDGRFQAVDISIGYGGLQRLATEQELPAPLKRLTQSGQLQPFEAEVVMDAQLMRVASELAQAMQSDASNALYREAKGLELIALLLMRWNERRTAPRMRLYARDRERLQEARERLLKNLADPPTIEQLADSCGMGLTRFREGFHSLFGKPVYEYLRTARLETARMLIQQGLSIQLAAYRVGYRDVSSFTRAFRKHFSFTPGCL